MYIESDSDNVSVLETIAKADDTLVVVGVLDSSELEADEDSVSVDTGDELEAGGVEDDEADAGACELAAGGVVEAGVSDVVDGGGGELVEESGVVVGEVLGSGVDVGVSLAVFPSSLVIVVMIVLIIEDMVELLLSCRRFARVLRCPLMFDLDDTFEMGIEKRVMRVEQRKSSDNSKLG